MPATYNLLPANAVKFRENSADSVVFHLSEHSPELPNTMTITRVLPTPRKGNAGTMKIMINVRSTGMIATADGERPVPIITKVETSVPVGAESQHLWLNFVDLARLLTANVNSGEDIDRLFKTGLLPDQSGSNDPIPTS